MLKKFGNKLVVIGYVFIPDDRLNGNISPWMGVLVTASARTIHDRIC